MRVNPLELGRLVDGDVSVDRHADDDIHGAGHERVDHRDLHVGLHTVRVTHIHSLVEIKIFSSKVYPRAPMKAH